MEIERRFLVKDTIKVNELIDKYKSTQKRLFKIIFILIYLQQSEKGWL